MNWEILHTVVDNTPWYGWALYYLILTPCAIIMMTLLLPGNRSR